MLKIFPALPVPVFWVLFLWAAAAVPTHVSAQSLQPSTIEELLNLKQEKTKTLFVVIPFKYRGLTENSSIVFGNRLADDLTNIPRFDAISPGRVLEFLNDSNPELLNCSDIDCGKMIARMFSARYFITTQLEFSDNRFQMDALVIDVAVGRVVYKTSRFFDKDRIYAEFDTFSRNIHQNLPIEVKVLGAGKHKVIINAGTDDGLKLYDKVIIYNRELLNFYDPRDIKVDTKVTVTNEEESLIETESTSISEEDDLSDEIVFDSIKGALSIIEITRLEPDKSEGIIKLTRNTAEPAVRGNMAKFYIDSIRQIQLYEVARREIDIYHGWEEEPLKQPKKVEKKEATPPPVIVPIPLPIIERNEWIHKVRHWEGERDFFQIMLVGSVALGLFTFYTYDTFHPIQLLPIGLTAYSAYAMLFSRAELNALIEEGKYKGYIRTIGDSYRAPQLNEDSTPGFRLAVNFEF